MNCPSCQHQSASGASFCEECGSRLAPSCASCGAELSPTAKFCASCGQAFEAYTPRHLAQKILTQRSALEGERKQVTVFFADILGSTELAEQVGPEQWHRVLERFFEILSEGVHRFEGTVNQYTGDGIMALFGAPIAHEDHAQRACYTALWLRDELRGFTEDLQREQGLDFQTRIGLNSGEVVVGKIGDDLRMDYTAQGQCVAIAQRMEALAEAGRVYLAPATTSLVEGYFTLDDRGEFKVKGASEPLRVHELAGVGQVRTRLEVARSRGFSDFVGRVHEMQALETALAQALDGHGQVVGVVGEAGVGKSRLCSEFLQRTRAQGTAVYDAHCPTHGKTLSLVPLLELLRGLFGISNLDDPHDAQLKITQELNLLGDSFDDVVPLVLDLLGVPDSERPVPAMQADTRQRRLFAFVRQFVQARSAREPAVLFLDDAHWIDSGSDAFLAQIVEALRDSRTLLLVNFRPEYHADWMGKSEYQQLPLRPLGPEEIEELLCDLMGSDPSVATLPRLIRERTAGNPFFIEEVVQSLVELGSLEGVRGAYQLVKAVESLEVPTTVQPLLAARIDRLPEREKRLLQSASVLGKDFSETLLKRVVDLPDSELAEALSHLQRGEFIVEQSLYPEVEYAFRHPLTQSVALDSQLSERRERAHARAAQALEELHADALDEQAALIAHHWEQAGEALEAARWHRRAAPWATRTDFNQALRHWRRVRALAGAAPESSDSLGLVVRACRGILETGFLAGFSSGEAEAAFAEGKALAERSGDVWSQARLAFGHANALLHAGDLAASENYTEEAATLAELAGDAGTRLAAQVLRFHICLLLGRLQDGLSELDRYVELGTSHAQHLDPAFLMLRRIRGNLLMHLGCLDEAQDEAENLVQLVGEKRNPASLMLAYLCRAELGYFVGAAASSLSAAQELMRVVEKLPMANMLTRGHLWLGVAHIRHEAWEPAIDEVEQALSIARQSRQSLDHEAQMITYLAEANLGGGENRRARELAMEAVSLARSQGARLYECQAQITLARALSKSENTDRTEDVKAALDRARELAEDMGARPFEAQIHEVSAELAALLGDDAGREPELREAHRLYTEMGATGHAERLARELGIDD